MLHRLVTWGPRVGFALLLAVLVGFELLFIAEANAGEALLQAERAQGQGRAMAALDEELLGALDVAEARLEALETLPQVEEDGLLLVRGGVQYFPRVPGIAGAASLGPEDEALLDRALNALGSPDEETRQKIVSAFRRGRPEFIPGREWLPVYAEVIDQQRLSPVLRLGLMISLLERAPASYVAENAQSLVLSAWPWLEKQDAASACVLVQRRGDELGVKTERFTAACQRGLAGKKVEVIASPQPRVVGEWLMVEREGEVRGVYLDLHRRLEELQKTLSKRGMIEAGEQVIPSPLQGRGGLGGLVELALISPRLDAALGSLRAAMWWKTVLLTMTGLLGLGVVLLARLAERRKEETLAVQRDFIATVSHELRTPLAGIRLMAETLERKLSGESAAKDYPHRLVVAADGLGFLVENILSFNRLESGRWVPRKEPFSFSSLEALLKEDAALSVDAAVEVKCEGVQQMASHQLDAQLIRVLVQNLLRNAWKYGRRQPVQFVVSGRDEGSVAVLFFSDNGPGIPQGEWERVFEAFHRLPMEEGRAVGGSGLGLALARRIAVLHGGTLRVSASSEAGTTFELRLPRG